MNGWFRKEDWWLVAIAFVMLAVVGLFACVGNTYDSSYRECFDRGGELVYFDRSGYRCVKRGVFLNENS